MRPSGKPVRRAGRHGFRRRKALIVAAITLFAIIAAVVGLLVLGVERQDVAVPDVIGISFGEAEEEVAERGLYLELHPMQNVEKIEDYGEMVISEQNPDGGDLVDGGTVVTVRLRGVEDYPEPERADGGPLTDQSLTPATVVDQTAPQAELNLPVLVPPITGTPKFPFTEDEAIACGEWESRPYDMPYFGAPRERGRIHAGVDLYPLEGEGAPISAMKDGTVIKVAPFFTRSTGEVTYGLLVDHGDFVCNYGELKPPSLKKGDTVRQGQLVGHLSGTEQLHFEMYEAGTTDWVHGWWGDKPQNLVDPTDLMLTLFGLSR